MSTRHMRKILGNPTLPPPDENSDDDFEPLYTKKQSAKVGYAALELDSASDAEPEPQQENEEDDQPEKQNNTNEEKRKKRKNKKNKKNKSGNTFDMDEIDKSVKEVNELLGEPLPVTSMEKPSSDDKSLFSVQQKYLNSDSEMTRMFGPDDDEYEVRRQRQRNVKHQKNIVIPKLYVFNNYGLSMSILRREQDVTYFVFNHSKEYQQRHRTFLELMKVYNATGSMDPREEFLRAMHVEALLESADVLFRVEELTAGNELVEQCVAYMQHVAHPCFSLTGRRTRLEYKYLENIPFHVALLKYLYLLTNRACHRTALEIAKVLLNLDPNDPLAVILIIDTLALRSREHKWLYEAVDHWNETKDGAFMFNLQYSQALASFHLSKAKNSNVSIEDANKLIQKTLLKFPYLLVKLLETCNQGVPKEIQDCVYLSGFATYLNTPKCLRDLMDLYVKLTSARWKEPSVYEWLVNNAKEIANNMKNEAERTSASEEMLKYSRMCQKWPVEIVRHLCIIKPMAKLLVDGAIPEDLPNFTINTNPSPPADLIDRYNYMRRAEGDTRLIPTLYSLLRHMRPDVNAND